MVRRVHSCAVISRMHSISSCSGLERKLSSTSLPCWPQWRVICGFPMGCCLGPRLMLAAAHGGFAEVVPHTLSSHCTRRTSSVEHALSSLIGLSVLTTLFKRDFYSNLQ